MKVVLKLLLLVNTVVVCMGAIVVIVDLGIRYCVVITSCVLCTLRGRAIK